jgi:hypothetical protein
VLAPFLVTLALANTPTPVPAWVPDLLEAWEPLVQPRVVVDQCGGINGWYQGSTHTIGLCVETFDHPQLARWIFQHELAHAFMAQHGLLDLEYEFAADELATLMADTQDVLAAAQWFSQMDYEPDAADPHPAPLERARTILCLERGFEETAGVCHSYLTSARDNWLRIIDLVL